MAALVTVIDEVVLLLHCNEPLALVDNMELPQLFVTDTTGADGDDFGADVPLPGCTCTSVNSRCYRISSCIGHSNR